jgi:hypothetical protein
MAFYSIEILQTTRNPRVLNLISSLSGLGVAEVKKRLKQLPMVVQASIPLSDAVSIERQLRKAGLQTRIVKSEVEVEDGWNNANPATNETGPEQEVKDSDEIIVIPEEEVKILHTSPHKAKKPDIKRKKIRAFSLRKHIAVLACVALFVFILSTFLILKSHDENAELEIILAMNQWSRTLNQQESLLDRGVTPQQILNKLTEIENKVNYLISKIRSRGRSNELKAKFQQTRADAQPALLDLEFRRKLEAAGFPIHPTCMVDLGAVRGVSDLPAGTLIRLQLSGGSGVEAMPFIAEIQGGVFELKLDPVIENYVFDARSTVAPYSQQNEKIRKWAVENLALPPDTSTTAPVVTPTGKTAALQQPELSPQEAASPGADIEATVLHQTAVTLEDSSVDAEVSAALETALSEWSATIRNAQGEIQSELTATWQEHYFSLLDLYKKLLELEARIDHLINLLRTDSQKNRWVLQREEIYGEFIGARSDLQKWHNEYLVRNNPFYLETALRRTLKQVGYPQAQVLVLDSPQTGDAFIIELEINSTQKRESFLSALTAVLDNEISKSPLKIEAVKLRSNDRIFQWKTDQIRRAAELLNRSDGMKRCADLLDPKKLL